MTRLFVCSSAAVLLLSSSAIAQDYNLPGSEQAAKTWRQDAADIDAHLNSRGPELVANRPIPDTPANRARYGDPDSRSGRLTAPIGD